MFDSAVAGGVVIEVATAVAGISCLIHIQQQQQKTSGKRQKAITAADTATAAATVAVAELQQ